MILINEIFRSRAFVLFFASNPVLLIKADLIHSLSFRILPSSIMAASTPYAARVILTLANERIKTLDDRDWILFESLSSDEEYVYYRPLVYSRAINKTLTITILKGNVLCVIRWMGSRELGSNYFK